MTGQYEDGPMDRPARSDPAVPFLNPEPIAHLVGWSNEAPIIVDGQKVTTLIDFEVQVSSVSSRFCKWMTLKVHPLDRLLELKGTGGSAILYLGYVEVNIQIPGIHGYNEDILQLVIPTTTYSEKVPVMVGSMIIGRAMGMITKGELVRTTATWKQAHFSAVISRSLQLPCKGARGWGCCKGSHSLHNPQPYHTKGILPGQCPGSCPYHTEGHHSSIWDHQHTWQHRHLRALYVGPHACQASTGPPAGHFHGTDCNIFRVAPRFILGANLSEEPECPHHCNPY